MNSPFMNSQAGHFADRVIEFAGGDHDKEVDTAFLLALGRRPSPAERTKAAQLFSAAPARDALARLGLVLFNVNEFLFLE
jgi:hypothetical protein